MPCSTQLSAKSTQLKKKWLNCPQNQLGHKNQLDSKYQLNCGRKKMARFCATSTYLWLDHPQFTDSTLFESILQQSSGFLFFIRLNQFCGQSSWLWGCTCTFLKRQFGNKWLAIIYIVPVTNMFLYFIFWWCLLEIIMLSLTKVTTYIWFI